MVALLSLLTHIIATYYIVVPIIVVFVFIAITYLCLRVFSSSVNWVALKRAGFDSKYKTPCD